MTGHASFRDATTTPAPRTVTARHPDGRKGAGALVDYVSFGWFAGRPMTRCRYRLSGSIGKGSAKKRTRMAVRGYPAVLLPSGAPVKSVSDATDGGRQLAESGEQKAELPAQQWSPARATVRALNGGASFAPVGVQIGLRLICFRSAWAPRSFLFYSS